MMGLGEVRGGIAGQFRDLHFCRSVRTILTSPTVRFRDLFRGRLVGDKLEMQRKPHEFAARSHTTAG